MPSFDRIYASSPVLAMRAQAAHKVGPEINILECQPLSFSQSASWQAQLVQTCSAAGRKRTRDEAAVNLDSPEKLVEAPILEDSEDEWVYGPGMALIKKSAGYVVDAGSQSGTWVEDVLVREEQRKAEAALLAQQELAQSRPSLRSHKSQRLDMATPSGTDERSPNRRPSPTREATNPMTASSDSLAQPIVDDFTLHLGIGWSRLSNDGHIQAAARGWARYIENHYPVTNVKILLESRGLQSYLVEATEGFFLFAENLRQGRLVSTTPEGTLNNLKISPPVFDGIETMDASDSLKPSNATASASSIDIDMK